MIRFAFAAAVLLGPGALPLAAQEAAEWTIETSLRHPNVSGAVVAPGGRHAAVVVTEPVLTGDSSQWRSTLHVMAVNAGPDAPPLFSEPDAAAPSWSPDGRWLAFASSRSGARNIWRIPAAGEPPRPPSWRPRLTAPS